MAHRGDAGHNAWRYLRLDLRLASAVKDLHPIAVLDAARLRIQRVDPHLLRASLLQYVDITVAGMGSGLVVVTKQL
ncbi:hypothetical protein D3C75_1318500 [compost metagenome]